MREYLDESETEPLLSTRKFSLDLTFERLLGAAAHNDYLVATQRVTHQMFQAAWESSGFIPRPASMRNDQHRSIFQAISVQNEVEAARLMADHVSLSIFRDNEAETVWTTPRHLPPVTKGDKP